MQVARIEVGGEKYLVLETVAQRLEDKEFVVHVGTNDTNRLYTVLCKLLIAIKLRNLVGQPPQVVILATSFGVLYRNIVELRAQVL